MEIPTFDLMREHAVVSRICLIYERMTTEILKKHSKTFKKLPIIIRDFIENYHEKMEEKYIFPYIKKEKELVTILIEQHKQSRKLTRQILSNPTPKLLKEFTDLYRWHGSMEDSIIFEEFKNTVDSVKQSEIMDIFEKTEKELFGHNTLSKFIKKIDYIEEILLE